jgi:hypothetical protein
LTRFTDSGGIVGVSRLRHSGEGRNPFSLFVVSARFKSKWIPAFAGMTIVWLVVR